MSTETVEINGVRIEVTTTTTVTTTPIEPPVVVPPPVEPPPVEPPPVEPPVTGKTDAGAPWPIGSMDVTPMQAPGGLRPNPTAISTRAIYLDPKKGQDGFTGRSWDDAKRTWQGVHAVIVEGMGGQEVVVRDGTDPGPVVWTKSGIADTDNGLIVIRPETPGGVTLTGDNKAYSIFAFEACRHVWLLGFSADGKKARGGHCIQFKRAAAIHITDCDIYGGQYGCLSAAHSDQLNVTRCIIRDSDLIDHGSGVSTWQPDMIGPDLPGYRIMFHGNIVHNIRYRAGRQTDQNGIIIDNAINDQDYPGRPDKPYLGAMLIAHNLVVGCAGAAIVSLWNGQAPIDVVHNTTWHNMLDDRAAQSWVGEARMRASPGTRWQGNIHVGNSDQGDPDSAAFNLTRTPNEPSNEGVWIRHNFLIDEGKARRHTRSENSPAVDPGMNWIGIDPLFVNPSAGPEKWDFALGAGSPARGVVPPLPSRWA